jgi:tetratricopeptide (TPR) repeat protein
VNESSAGSASASRSPSPRQEVRVESGFGYGVIGADLHVFADRGPIYLLREHHPTPTPDTGWLLEQPSRLLDARYAVVGFTGRGDDLARLEDWRESGPRMAARWLHGPGGQGKTRLASEFARRSAAARWKVVTAVHGTGTIFSPPGSEDLRLGDAAGLLLLVDYADRWSRSDLAWLFSNALLHRPVPIRLVLVARGIGLWPSVRAELDRHQAGTSEHALRPLADVPGEREGMYAAALHAFTGRYGDVRVTGTTPAELSTEPEYGLALAIHMAALVRVDAAANGRRRPSGVTALSAYLLDREREHWAKLAASHADGSDYRTAPRVMARTVFTASLTGALAHREGKSLLERLDLPAHPEQVLSDHAVCYPPADPRHGAVLEPLYPDRLAEDFLALMLPGHDLEAHPADPWAATSISLILASTADNASPRHLGRAIAVLTAAAGRWPHVGADHLYPLLLENPRQAVSAGGAALAGLAGLPTVPTSLLEAIEPHLPERRDVDLDVGIAALASRLAAERLGRHPGLVDRARIQGDLSVLMSHAGRNAEALHAAEEAVALARRLVDREGAAREPDLAAALTTLCGALSQVGRRQDAFEAATEAVAIHRQLAGETPAAFAEGLAVSLHNLSIALAGAGLRDEAVEAAEEAVRLGRHPDDLDGQGRLAGALDNLRLRLLEVGRLTEALTPAEEAVAAHRELASADPGAFRPDLARALSNHSVLLTKVRRHEEAVAAAEEAVAICRELATTNPAAFETDLAISLTNLGNALSESGERDEARERTDEAVTLYRRLVRDNAALEVNLALSLSNLGKHLSDIGERAAGLDATEQAVEIRRRLAADNPDAHSPGLAKSLDQLGQRLLAVGRLTDGAVAAGEAVELRRALAAQHPAAFTADLADALTNQGTLLWALGRPQDAVATTQEAIEIRREPAAPVPTDKAPELAAALTNLSAMLAALGRLDEALDAATEAVALSRHQARTDPSAAAPGLAAALANLGLVLAAGGQRAEAAAATEESVDIRRRLAVASPAAFEPVLAESLTNFSADLAGLGRLAEALATAEEAVGIYRGWVDGDNARFGHGLASALLNLCIALWSSGRREESLSAGLESVETFQALARRQPGTVDGELRNAQALVKELLERTGRTTAPPKGGWLRGLRRRKS